MNPRLRAALLALAAICVIVAMYYPVAQFFENKALDDEMDALRQLKRQAGGPEVSPAPSEVSSPETDRDTIDRSLVSLPEPAEGTDLIPGKTDREDRAPGEPSAAADMRDDTRRQTARIPAASHGTEGPDATVNAPEPSGALGSADGGRKILAVSPDDAQTESASLQAPTPEALASAQSDAAAKAHSSPAPLAAPRPEPTPFVFDETRITPEFKPIYAENPDLVGWLKIDGTVIDYPVVQREDEQYYLTRDFYGRENANGQLILDAQCDAFTPDMNLVISGHNMKSGKMFGTLVNYASKSYGRKHAIIQFDTLFRKGEYKLVAAFYTWDYLKRADGFHYNVDIRYRLEMLKFLEELNRIKLYDTGVSVEFGDELIMLSTCSYQTDDGRFVVVARKLRDGETP